MESITITMRGKMAEKKRGMDGEEGGGVESAQLSQRLRLLQNFQWAICRNLFRSEMEELSLQDTIFPLRLLIELLATIKRQF